MREFIVGFLVAFTIIILFIFFGKSYYINFLIGDINKTECPKCPEPKIIERNITIREMVEENLTSKQRLKRALANSDFIAYPKKLTLIGLKHERKLEVWGELDGDWRHITDYAFTAFSGLLGPKLKEGDGQIPEGIYGISYLNPNSKFHLSMRIDYPNSFDKKMAKREKRVNLGGDIMIHGSNKTVGCIPIGDDKIEELYFLAQKVGIDNIRVILSPVDFRKISVKVEKGKHPWVNKLYGQIKEELKEFY